MAPELTRRMQILLDERRFRALQQRAEQENISVGAFVRSAIDGALREDAGTRYEAAAAAFLDAQPLPVGELDELERELEDTYERGG